MRTRTAASASGWAHLRPVAAWIELTKPRIASMVVLSAFVGALLAGGSVGRAFVAALCIGGAAAASAMFNHVLERDTDRLMERTKHRPLVTGELRARDAILAASALGAAATFVLASEFNVLSALLSLTALLLYALVYTPLKRLSTLNTFVGAIPGAMPPLLGYAAIAGAPASWGWSLFAVFFCWQFPHFMAIAWLHREDYARAGMKMLPAMPDNASAAGRQALLYAVTLLPVSLLPAAHGEAGAVYAFAALALGLAYSAFALLFALQETPRRARLLLLASLVYVPLLLAAILLDPRVQGTLFS
jgi:protoheme IX farnesyltransferase